MQREDSGSTGEVVLAILVLTGLVAAVIYFCVWRLRKSDDPGTLVKRWGLSLGVVAFLVFCVGPLLLRGDYVAAFGGVPLAAVGGVLFALIWINPLVEAVGKFFAQLYDGGDTELTPEPLLSIAEANRKQGRYHEAVEAIRTQLESFPDHYGCWMMMAEIYAEDLHDLESAQRSIEHLVQPNKHSPKNTAAALTRLADWQIKYLTDLAPARRTFERIMELYPNSSEAHFATQRLAHLHSKSGEAPVRMAVPQAAEGLSLQNPFREKEFQKTVVDRRVREMVAQLEQFPEDNQTREELAMIYAQDLGLPELALDQLQQLVDQPFAPLAQKHRWLNYMVDILVTQTGDAARAASILEQIVIQSPEGSAAEMARRRLATLGVEARATKKGRAMKLGSYESDLGLKRGRPRPNQSWDERSG